MVHTCEVTVDEPMVDVEVVAASAADKKASGGRIRDHMMIIACKKPFRWQT